MRGSITALVVAICLSCSQAILADSIFDFGTADRTFLGGPVDPVPIPGVDDFLPTPGPRVFLVGNLTNFCGLFPGEETRSKAGTECIDPMDGTLSDRIDYDTGADTFTLLEDTLLQLQVIVKVGHPERALDHPSRDQDQDERFDIFLESNTTTLMLAQLLDDVSEDDFEVTNGYYRYVYEPKTVPAGTWYPSFVAVSGSIDFLTQLSSPIPEPGTVVLFGSGLAGLAFVAWRRRRSL